MEPWEICLSIAILWYAIGFCLFSEIALLIASLISHIPNKVKSATQPPSGFVFRKIKRLVGSSYLGRKSGPWNDQSLQLLCGPFDFKGWRVHRLAASSSGVMMENLCFILLSSCPPCSLSSEVIQRHTVRHLLIFGKLRIAEVLKNKFPFQINVAAPSWCDYRLVGLFSVWLIDI